MTSMMPRKLKTLINKQRIAIEAEVKMMLHAHRDCLRNRFLHNGAKHDPKHIRFVIDDGYFGEAFGIMRTLQVLNYGFFGAVNTPTEFTNLRWWFAQLEQEVLREENFGGSGECDWCLNHYGKDDAGRRKA